MELKCFISCAPLTTTTWEKDGIPLLSSNLISLSEKTGVRTMTLHCAKPGDSGSYRMTITNSSGTASCAANITVRSESLFSLRHQHKICGLNMSFFPKASDPPPHFWNFRGTFSVGLISSFLTHHKTS